EQARRALDAGRDDLARIALERKHAALIDLASLDEQRLEDAEEERKLSVTQQQVAGRIQQFAIRRASLSAPHTAAEAQVRLNAAPRGVPGELAELSMALGRAEEKTARLKARASAIDALIDGGQIPLAATNGDVVELELQRIESARTIDT